jgi:hypothetical protein
MLRHRLGYVNRTALNGKEQSMASQNMASRNIASQNMATPNTTVASHGRMSMEPSPAKLEEARCAPMSHQNSGSHGHEMYPQQFVRLIGCHDASLEALRKRASENLH